MLKSGLEQSKDITRLEYKVFSLERLYPSSPVEVSKSQTKIMTPKKLGTKSFVKCRQGICCLDKCHNDRWHLVIRVPRSYL